jgi:hypothetical protein
MIVFSSYRRPQQAFGRPSLHIVEILGRVIGFEGNEILEAEPFIGGDEAFGLGRDRAAAIAFRHAA